MQNFTPDTAIQFHPDTIISNFVLMHEYHPEIIDNAVCLRLYVNGSKTSVSYRLDFDRPRPEQFPQEEWNAALKMHIELGNQPF